MALISIGVHSALADLVGSLTDAAEKFDKALDGAVRDVAKEGNRLARENATRTAGRHGKRYPRSMSVERVGPATYVYGPNAAMPQGGMSFEGGSRNQPPHNDLANSADVIGPKLARKVGDAIDEALR